MNDKSYKEIKFRFRINSKNSKKLEAYYEIISSGTVAVSSIPNEPEVVEPSKDEEIGVPNEPEVVEPPKDEEIEVPNELEIVELPNNIEGIQG